MPSDCCLRRILEELMEVTVGGRIAALRRAAGLSQADLAERTGVSRSAVAQWETDRAGQMRGNLARIAAALDVSVEVLLQGDQARGLLVTMGDELALMRLYRNCSVSDQGKLLRLARQLATTAVGGA